jgi:hypothetical protein
LTWREVGITLIRGMEFSTRVRFASVQLLAYLFDRRMPASSQNSADPRRGSRAEQMVGTSAEPDSRDDVLARTTDGATIGRPHIADALVRSLVSPREAFAESCTGGRLLPAALCAGSAPRSDSCGGRGVPVLAHPATRGVAHIVPEERLADMVEPDYSDSNRNPRERAGGEGAAELAAKFGGSDRVGDYPAPANRPARENTTAPGCSSLIEQERAARRSTADVSPPS